MAAKNAEAGDINGFLRNVLVEVATENYRQLMYEVLWQADSASETSIYLDPPLRANERILSGLFANAIAKVAPRSRPEARINRIERIEEDQTNDVETESPPDRAGRIDYLAWYGNRLVGVELKAATINCDSPAVTLTLQRRWDNVVEQAASAQQHLRKLQRTDKARYANPVSLALMVIIGRRTMSEDVALNWDGKKVATKHSEFTKALIGMAKRPQFVATYTFPEEFRMLARRKKGNIDHSKEGGVFTPFVGFVARIAVNTTSS